MRLFVAVEIDDQARLAAEATAEALRVAIGPALKARWVPAENLHVTVRFIGQVDDDRAPGLIETLARPLDIPRFDLALGGCGLFPSSGPPRALWIGLPEGSSSLAAMHDACDQRLRPFGFELDARPFNAHLTIARVKDAPKGAGLAVREALRRVTPPKATCRVTRATIFQSHLSPRGPRYEAIAFTSLAP